MFASFRRLIFVVPRYNCHPVSLISASLWRDAAGEGWDESFSLHIIMHHLPLCVMVSFVCQSKSCNHYSKIRNLDILCVCTVPSTWNHLLPITHPMDTHRKNFGSLGTFSFNENNTFSTMELKGDIIIQSILAHTRTMVLNILASHTISLYSWWSRVKFQHGLWAWQCGSLFSYIGIQKQDW